MMVILIISFFVLAISTTKDHINRNHFMYSDIELLDVLSQYIIMPIDEDSYLNGLIPLEHYLYKIEWAEKEYSVYAYEFENSLQCMQYVSSRMRISFDDNSSYYLSSNVFCKTRYIAFSDNKLIYIEGPDIKSTYEFLDFIEQNFDVDLNKKN